MGVETISSLHGKSVVTLEGLGSISAPHPLQAAFIKEQVPQCGYCTSGMIMSAAALLTEKPKPTEAKPTEAKPAEAKPDKKPDPPKIDPIAETLKKEEAKKKADEREEAKKKVADEDEMADRRGADKGKQRYN